MADISTALFLPFKYPSAGYSAVVQDAAGTNTRQFITSGKWYIIAFAHSSSPAGTVVDPVNLLKHITNNLGASRWLVSLTNTGKVSIRNLGAGSASIAFATSAIPYSLGFTSLTLTFTAGETKTSDYQPTHSLFAFAREEDTGWISKGQITAATNMPDGSTYGWTNGNARWERGCNLRYHPKDVSMATGVVSNITPAYPDKTNNTAQWKAPSDSPVLYPPFSAHNFLNSTVNNGIGKVIAACFGNFQNNIAGTDLSFEQVSLTADSVKNEHFEISIPNYDKFRNINNMVFSFYSHQSRVV